MGLISGLVGVSICVNSIRGHTQAVFCFCAIGHRARGGQNDPHDEGGCPVLGDAAALASRVA